MKHLFTVGIKGNAMEAIAAAQEHGYPAPIYKQGVGKDGGFSVLLLIAEEEELKAWAASPTNIPGIDCAPGTLMWFDAED